MAITNINSGAPAASLTANDNANDTRELGSRNSDASIVRECRLSHLGQPRGDDERDAQDARHAAGHAGCGGLRGGRAGGVGCCEV